MKKKIFKSVNSDNSSVDQNLSQPEGHLLFLSYLFLTIGKGNGTPLRTLAWKIPWTEHPGGPQSMG